MRSVPVTQGANRAANASTITAGEQSSSAKAKAKPTQQEKHLILFPSCHIQVNLLLSQLQKSHSHTQKLRKIDCRKKNNPKKQCYLQSDGLNISPTPRDASLQTSGLAAKFGRQNVKPSCFLSTS